MPAQRSYRFRSRCEGRSAHPPIIERLDPSGPLHPDSGSTGWPIHDPFDAIDALDLLRPVDFDSGVLVLFVDAERVPVVTLAVRNAPADGLEPIVSLVAEAAEMSQVEAIVMGIVERESSDSNSPNGTPHPQAPLDHWVSMARVLDQHDTELLDILTLHDSCWSSVALTSGHLSYPEAVDPRPRWFDLTDGTGLPGQPNDAT